MSKDLNYAKLKDTKQNESFGEESNETVETIKGKILKTHKSPKVKPKERGNNNAKKNKHPEMPFDSEVITAGIETVDGETKIDLDKYEIIQEHFIPRIKYIPGREVKS